MSLSFFHYFRKFEKDGEDSDFWLIFGPFFSRSKKLKKQFKSICSKEKKIKNDKNGHFYLVQTIPCKVGHFFSVALAFFTLFELDRCRPVNLVDFGLKKLKSHRFLRIFSTEKNTNFWRSCLKLPIFWLIWTTK